MEPNGYTSDTTTNDPDTPDVDERLTLVDYGRFDACPRLPDPIEDYGEGVVTPHAAFLALEFAPEETMANLAGLEADFPDLYGRGGFKDSVNVATGQIADRYLALDQGMVIAAAANELLDGQLQRLPGRHARRPARGVDGDGAVRRRSHRRVSADGDRATALRAGSSTDS